MDEERNYCRKRFYVQDNCTDDEASKRRNFIGQIDAQNFRSEHTVYRYLCPKGRVGYVIGRGGEFVKQIRADTGARIIIEDSSQECNERPVTISSSSRETNPFGYVKEYVCPAQDALFRVHERLFGDDHLDRNEDDGIGACRVTARLLIPSDQARCVIGRRGCSIQSIRRDTGATINIWKYEHIPVCAMNGEELLEISGDSLVVKDALFQISCILQGHPSRSHVLFSSEASFNPSGGNLVKDPVVGSNSPRDENREFTVRLVCPSVNIREVIGRGGAIINKIRQESGASIDLDCFFDEDDCLILVSAKELQPRCSMKESECGEPSFVTRILVQRTQLGGLIGKRGSIIKEIRRKTQARISIVEDSLPSIVSDDDDAMIQISGDPVSARSGLIQVIEQLKASYYSSRRLFSVETSASSYAMSRNGTDRSMYTGGSHEQQNGRNSTASDYGASLGRLPLDVREPCSALQDDGDG
ncbi:hypothetical protein HPP92_002739 [Vanilla planifolia]|uniref:K Homology domain-containing protein n=1 Tax=Vanilla planifolia TaxID=51239 RepID=A0A835S621_VANPL|nr:hypothetical protein HPP92_002739 [Vanilla planifolia]